MVSLTGTPLPDNKYQLNIPTIHHGGNNNNKTTKNTHKRTRSLILSLHIDRFIYEKQEEKMSTIYIQPKRHHSKAIARALLNT